MYMNFEKTIFYAFETFCSGLFTYATLQKKNKGWGLVTA